MSSGSLGDVTNLSLFGTSNLSLATSYAANAYGMMQVDASGYLGSATVVTQPKFTGGVPAQATPNSIAAVADSFVGQAWNMDGCWVLASTIAAEAGASLPVQSTAIGLPGQANGEWIVAFNGPAGAVGQLAVHGHRRRDRGDRHTGRRRPHHHLRLRVRQHRDAGGQHHLRELAAARCRIRPTTVPAATSSSPPRMPPRRNGPACRGRRS